MLLSWQIVAKLSTTSSVTWCVTGSTLFNWEMWEFSTKNANNWDGQVFVWFCVKRIWICKIVSYFISWLSNTSSGSKCDDHTSGTRATCPWRPVLATVGVSGLTKVVLKKEAQLTCCFQKNTRNVFCTKSSELYKTRMAKSCQINTWMQWVSLEDESVWAKIINYIVSILG